MPNFTIDKIENALENENNAKIMELDSAKIAKEKNDILQKLNLPRCKLKDIMNKLKDYRYFDLSKFLARTLLDQHRNNY